MAYCKLNNRNGFKNSHKKRKVSYDYAPTKATLNAFQNSKNWH